MNAYELADQVEMWGEDLLSLNMKGGVPVTQGAKMLRQQFDQIADLKTTIKFLEEECKALRMQTSKAMEVQAK